MLLPSKMKPLKPRTNSVMSSSVGSSPATSFDAGGKFWGGHRGGSGGGGGRRVRTVSEGSEDDLIEFVSDGCADYLADVFSDTDDDEDYSSDEEEESESEDESDEESEEDKDDDDDEETESDTDYEEGHHITRTVSLRDARTRAFNSDLPDSGVEEKKVS